MEWFLTIIAFAFLFLFTVLLIASRYKRCPSDKILVVYGKVGEGQTAHCIHGGGVFVWPLIQDYAFMSLTPMTIGIPLQRALSLQNIRINVPSTFTVGVSTEPGVMQNAAERLLNLDRGDIEEMAKEIIFGQLRLTVASLTIEQINQDRESFLEAIRKNVSPELNKIGLYLINVNITDITDESDYIESIGKKAAAEAINQARIDVAEQDRHGSIGHAQATMEKEIKVAENVAAADKGKKQAEAGRRIFVQQQETLAAIGEADAEREKEIKLAENKATADKGKKHAEADRRVYVREREAEAIAGENKAQADIAAAEAELAVRQAESLQRGELARLAAQVEINKAQYLAEQERLAAAEVVRQEIEKRKVEIAAEADAERARRLAKGEADAILLKYEAEAKGLKQVLESKAAGYLKLLEGCQGDARSVATLLLIEKLHDIVGLQVEAIRNLKIDKLTVWDSGASADGSTTSNFLSSLIKSLPPLHDIAEMAGVELPKFLGEMVEEKKKRPAAE
jgi:flotillin